MKNQEILDALTYDDLNDDMKFVHDQLGMETVKLLLVHCGGSSFHVPQIKRIRTLMKRYLKGKDKRNIKKIANEMGMSDRYISGLGI